MGSGSDQSPESVDQKYATNISIVYYAMRRSVSMGSPSSQLGNVHNSLYDMFGLYVRLEALRHNVKTYSNLQNT